MSRTTVNVWWPCLDTARLLENLIITSYRGIGKLSISNYLVTMKEQLPLIILLQVWNRIQLCTRKIKASFDQFFTKHVIFMHDLSNEVIQRPLFLDKRKQKWIFNSIIRDNDRPSATKRLMISAPTKKKRASFIKVSIPADVVCHAKNKTRTSKRALITHRVCNRLHRIKI